MVNWCSALHTFYPAVVWFHNFVHNAPLTRHPGTERWPDDHIVLCSYCFSSNATSCLLRERHEQMKRLPYDENLNNSCMSDHSSESLSSFLRRHLGFSLPSWSTVVSLSTKANVPVCICSNYGHGPENKLLIVARPEKTLSQKLMERWRPIHWGC